MISDSGFISSQIHRLSGRIFEKILRDSEIDVFNGAQGRILYVLWDNKQLTISQIGKLTSLSKSTLTSMLDLMEQKGLIVRIPDTKNRRQIFVQATEKVKGYKDKYSEVSEKMLDISYRGFTEEEMQEYESMLLRIKHNLESYMAEEMVD